MQSFTSDILQDRPIDESVKRDMISSIVRQYDSIAQFRVYVPVELDPPMSRYQTSLTSLRATIIQTKSKKDLDAFYLTLAATQESRKAILPILEKIAGRKES